MKSLKTMNDDQINRNLLTLAQRERELIGEILRYLREVETRKLYLKRGHSSLFTYLVNELGYAESTAYQRISALKMMRETRDRKLLNRIESGKLSLNAVTEARKVFDQKERDSGEKLSSKEKRTLISSLEGKSRKEREKEFQKVLGSEGPPSALPREVRRHGLKGEQRIHMSIRPELKEKLERCRELMAHRLKSNDTCELMDLLAEEYLKKNDPLRKKSSKKSSKESAKKPAARALKKPPKIPIIKSPKKSTEKAPSLTPNKPSCRTLASSVKSKTTRKTTRYIPKKTREEVHRKANGQCQYRDPKTGRLCGSRYKTQIDHIVPFSHNGDNELNNLQLLCASHNGFKGARRSPA
jgi:5-methylcytosine-specific restriction endonuclease McrA